MRTGGGTDGGLLLFKVELFTFDSFPAGSLGAKDKKEKVRVRRRQNGTIPRVVESAAARERRESFQSWVAMAG